MPKNWSMPYQLKCEVKKKSIECMQLALNRFCTIWMREKSAKKLKLHPHIAAIYPAYIANSKKIIIWEGGWKKTKFNVIKKRTFHFRCHKYATLWKWYATTFLYVHRH